MPDLFTNIKTIDDLLFHIERKADKVCSKFNISFGFWKNSDGTINHSAMIVLTTKTGRFFSETIKATTLREMIQNIDNFLLTIH